MNHDITHHVRISIDGWGSATYDPHDPRTVESVRKLVNDHLEQQATERTIYVVAQHRDDKPARVEVYSDFDVAQARQRELGVGSTTLASRRIDDPLLMQRLRVIAAANAEAAKRAAEKAEREAAERADAAVKEAERLKAELEAQARQAQGWLPDVSTLSDLKRRFTSWPMSEEQQAEDVRRGARDLAETIACLVPQGPERDRALDALEQASMLAVAGIARPPVGPTAKSEA